MALTLEEARDMVGQKVVYRADHVRPDEPGEEGVVTSVNDTWVFVRYGTSTTSAATSPSLLTAVSR